MFQLNCLKFYFSSLLQLAQECGYFCFVKSLCNLDFLNYFTGKILPENGIKCAQDMLEADKLYNLITSLAKLIMIYFHFSFEKIKMSSYSYLSEHNRQDTTVSNKRGNKYLFFLLLMLPLELLHIHHKWQIYNFL